MKNKWALFLSGFVLFLSSCRPLESLQFLEVSGFDLGMVSTKSSSIIVDLSFYNPNKSKLKLKSARVDVYLENRYLGETTLDSLVIIPARDTFLLPVIINVDMKKVLPNLLILASKKEVLIKFDGMARVGKGAVFVNYPITYEGLQSIR